MRLTSDLESESTIVYKGNVIHLDLYFDVVLKALELKEDNAFKDYEKLVIWATMFIRDKGILKEFDLNDLQNIVPKIFEKISGDNSETSSNDEEVFCFVQDADYIYAAFLSEYGIDLIEQQGKLHWYKFSALLKSLSDQCKFSKIIEIRTREVPQLNKHNAKEREELLKLKKVYALKVKDPQKKVQKLNSKFNNIAFMVAGQVKKNV